MSTADKKLSISIEMAKYSKKRSASRKSGRKNTRRARTRKTRRGGGNFNRAYTDPECLHHQEVMSKCKQWFGNPYTADQCKQAKLHWNTGC